MTRRRTSSRSVLGIVLAAGVIVAADLGWAAGDKPYKVVEGYKVDSNTMNGFRAWRAAACDRCHGANQEGLVGPSLLERMRTISKEDFAKVIVDGRVEKGMPGFSTSETVKNNMDGLYAYLKGRANGDITKAKVEELKE